MKIRIKKILASSILINILLISLQIPVFQKTMAQYQPVVWKRSFSYNPPPVGHFNYFISGSIGIFDWVLELMTHYFAANGTYIPCVAESWQLDPDYMWFQVKLRKEVKFHDGHELTYKDVLATLYCAYLLKDRLGYFIKDVQVIDDYTIKFNFKEKTDYPVFYILWHWMIVSYNQYGQIADKVQARIKEGKDIFANDADFQDLINELNQFRPEKPIGCGPYKLKSINETMIVLEAFENYWNGKPPIDEIHLIRYASNDAMWSDVLNGKLDYLWAISPNPDLVRQLEAKPWAWTIRIPRPIGVTLYINKAKYPLSLVEVRRALAYAINRSEVGWVQYTGGCVPSKYVIGFHVPDLTRYLNQSFINRYLKDFEYAYNPAKAEQILQSLGFRKGADNVYVTPNGTRLEFTLIIDGTWVNAPAAENLKAQLEKVGIKINVVVDYATWLNAVCNGTYDLASGYYGSPNFAFDEYYHKYMAIFLGHDPAKTWGQMHFVPWKAQPVNVTELAKKILLVPVEISQAELTEIYSELSYITGSEVPVINLYQPAVVIYMNKKFVFPTDLGYWNGLAIYELHGLRPLFTYKWLKPLSAPDGLLAYARLNITVLTGDGRPLEKAWVYIVDAYSKENLTAALTGEEGVVNFYLLRGWYWLDEHKVLTNTPVNPDWDPVSNNNPPQPLGGEYIQYLTFKGRSGWARFFGKYYIVVYYKPGGCFTMSPAGSEVVFDSYTDDPQHQPIYLGIKPETEASATTNFSPSQAKVIRTFVSDLRIEFTDSAGRPLTGVNVYFQDIVLAQISLSLRNIIILPKVPLRSGTSYAIRAEWTSKYGTKATATTSITAAETSISLPIYDVTLRLLTPRGTPLVGVPVKVAGADVGLTDAAGSVLVPQIPPGSYSVAASWLETALSLPSLVVSAPGAVTLTPTNLHVLTVRVIGAQGQALEGATVRVTKGAVEVTRLTDKDGKAQIELPDASYNIEVTYGQFSKTDSVTMTADTLKTFNLDVFIEFLGVGMSMAQFLLFIVILIFLIGLSGTMFMKKRKTAGKARKKIKEEIEKYEKYLERLEELRKANKVSLQAYEKLKSEYESKIEELKKENTKTT